MTIIAVQCRLDSTRLPNKALLPLGSIELVRWTLRALKKVHVDEYWLACDEDSHPVLSQICTEEGWQCFMGPKDDVLERYCLLAEKTGANVIIRATADNPFLFYEAAQASIDEFTKTKCDYFAFTGLPHGSGIEIFSAVSLLRAKTLTNDLYDHEHVGPALYNHPENFNVVFKSAPKKWYLDADGIRFRTTVDTTSDYRFAQRVHDFLQEKACTSPYSAENILLSLKELSSQTSILLVPTVQEGRGTGHLRRILKLSTALKQNYNTHTSIFIGNEVSAECATLLDEAFKQNKCNQSLICKDIPHKGEFSCILIDAFEFDKSIAKKLYGLAPLIALDEGGDCSKYIDYALNSIPSLIPKKNINAFMPELLELPRAQKRKVGEIKKILVSIGGEDPAKFSETIYHSLMSIFSNNIQIDSTHISAIPNLSDCIGEYDLVITHFGFTAFEAITAGCYVVTVATSSIHRKLSRKYDLVCLEKKDCTPQKLQQWIFEARKIAPKKLSSLLNSEKKSTLDSTIMGLLQSSSHLCPVCQDANAVNPVISRDPVKTIRKCATCTMIYISFCAQEEKEYSKDYFFDEYKNQYGKTYLEDFDMIKLSGFLRMERIRRILKYSYKNVEDTVLDIGCAYGPFLEAVKMISFKPYGTDISKDAVDYVVNTLSHTAAVASFPNISVKESFGKFAPKNGKFRVVTMWYVIEHFQNLDEVLKKVNSLLVPGGVFAFSTPNALGISRRNNQKDFFKQSPYDHFSIWDYKVAKKILKKYGFTVRHFESTGIHWQRYPKILQKLHLAVIFKLAEMFNLGDTFEIYCVKYKELK